ncbi:hypothetical protein HanRHA438_Chr05g0224171 [Helianthus annuus]|nr:hypothetical protein HanRHA438_Chr05g0224171 [Helianthus annuus]
MNYKSLNTFSFSARVTHSFPLYSLTSTTTCHHHPYTSTTTAQRQHHPHTTTAPTHTSDLYLLTEIGLTTIILVASQTRRPTVTAVVMVSRQPLGCYTGGDGSEFDMAEIGDDIPDLRSETAECTAAG